MKKILIVDDSAFMRSVLKELLTEKSTMVTGDGKLEIFEADGKVNALNQLKKIKPHVILLDIVMKESEKEGLEFIQEIQDVYDPKKIIIISSIGQTAILDECQKLGVKNYLQKPFEKNEVIETVHKILI